MPHVQTRWQSLRIEPYISKKTLEHFRYSLCINSSIHVSCTRWHQPTNLEAFKATSRDTRLGSPASLDLFAGLNSPVQAINATRVSLDTALASFTRRTQTQTAKKQQLVKWHASVLAQPASTQPPRAGRAKRAGPRSAAFTWVSESLQTKLHSIEFHLSRKSEGSWTYWSIFFLIRCFAPVYPR